MYMFDYIIERRLPTGNWQRVTGTISAKTSEEVEKILVKQNSSSAIRIISIKKK